MIALSTVTKVGGLGALRVGWIIAHPRLLRRFKTVKDYTTICGSSVSQLLAVWALKQWSFFLRRAKRVLDQNRRIAGEAFERIPALHGDVPKGGTVMFPHSDVNVRKLSARLLRRYKTVIAEGRFFGRDEHFMRLALREAERAADHDDVPIGAVVVRRGEVIGAAGNERELRGDSTAHAEVLAIRQASQTIGGWRIPDSVLYVTLEPCPMCAGAIVHARLARLVYGAGDPKAGAAGSALNLLQFPTFNHRCEITAGVREGECRALLQAFFAEQRTKTDKGT